MTRIAIFCGSSAGARPAYAEAARMLGRTLAQKNIGVVYGGSSIGLMGIIADAALEHGGEAIGVIPRSMVDREIAHDRLTELYVVETMHERKAKMTALANAFLAIPGGHGTFDELFEALTWSQLGIHSNPIGVWNVERYFDPLIAALDHAVAEGFVRPRDRARLIAEIDLEELLRALVP